MVSYILRRVGVGAGLIFLVLTIIFFIVRAVPGDPAEVLASGGMTGQATPEAIEQMRRQLGLDMPLATQYVNYLVGVVTGDLGVSFGNGRPVTTVIMERLPNTLELVVAACVLGTVAGILLGALAARRGGVADAVVTALSSLAISVPVYVLGVLFVYVFALSLGWLPAGGFAPWARDPGRHIESLVLPAVVLAIPFSAIIARMTRSSMLEVQRQDWVRTARSWGMRPSAVFLRHVLRNSLTPVTTVIGLEVGLMLGSTVLAERVFTYPGLSELLVDAITDRDYPVVQGIVITISVLFILLNILVDTLYGVLDPRVRR